MANNIADNRQWLENWIEVQTVAKLVERKEYFDYLAEDDDFDESFEEWNSDMSVVSMNHKQATSDEIAKLEAVSKQEFSQPLKDFWQEVGKFGGEVNTGEMTIKLPPVEEFLYSFSEESRRYEKLTDLGLISMMNWVWDNDKDIFKIKAGQTISNGDDTPISFEQLQSFNNQFSCFGFITDGYFESHLFLHYEQQNGENGQKGNFGATYWHQDNDVPLTQLVDGFESPEALIIQCLKGYAEIRAEDEEDPYFDMEVLSEWLVKNA